MPLSLRQSTRLQVGDHIYLRPYHSPIQEAKEVILRPEESTDLPLEQEGIRFYLRDTLRITTASFR
jgi:hypothetical protein